AMMKKFRHIIEIALNKEWIYRNPFKEFKLQWQKVDRGYLTQAEIETMIDFQFEDKRMEKARDIFIFCTFTGLAYVDVKNLTNSHIQSSFDDKLWIKGKRKKNRYGIQYSLVEYSQNDFGKIQRKNERRFGASCLWHRTL
ncbi:hypothetical protein EZS27_025286, partial [termite gut metagenome]